MAEITKADMELAAAVVLVDIASSDERFSPSEYEAIADGLKRLFDTPRDRVKNLVNQAQQILSGLRGVAKYAIALREGMSHQERLNLLAVVRDLVAADGVEDPFEVYLTNRLRKDLSIEDA